MVKLLRSEINTPDTMSIVYVYVMVTLLQLKEKCSRQKTKLSSLREEIIDFEVRLFFANVMTTHLLLIHSDLQLKQFEWLLKEVNKLLPATHM